MTTNDTEPVELGVPDITADRLAALRDLIPEAFSEGKVDFDKLRAALGDVVDERPERYSFTWAGKRDALRLLQTPSSATLVPAREESVNWETTQHLFIEGDNLEVLKLLYKAYFGKVKLIYIDPPYNTGHDFVYPDNYADPLSTYLAVTGQSDEAGNLLTSNPDTGGRYHSTWLSMMYPRLFLARQLLREEGVIFVSIDDKEVHNLRHLLNEVFGEENFLAHIIWQHSVQGKNDVKGFSLHHNHLLVFSKSSNYVPVLLQREEKHNVNYSNPDNDPKGLWRSGDVRSPNYRENLRYELVTPSGKRIPPPENGWRWSHDLMQEKIRSGEVRFVDNETRILRKIYLADQEGRVPESIWFGADVGTSRIASSELKQLFDGYTPFDTPKPTALVQRMMEVAGVVEGDVVLDFFAGSATVGHAVLRYCQVYGRSIRYLLVQLPEPTPSDSVARANGFQNIAEIGMERLRRAIKLLQREQGKLPLNGVESAPDLGFRVFKLAPSTLRAWRGTAAPTPAEYVEQLALLGNPLADGWRAEDVVWEVTIKEGFPLTSAVSTAAAAGQQVWRVADADSGRVIHVCLDDVVTAGVAEALGLGREDVLVVRDAAVDDTTAANLALQCRLKTL
ncbi:MAG: site-specific DNA-methyltransferase [Candidatus Promineofilum sp.]|nr:site-specific DNA-methyltransferase [Promineifilum sp.]